MPESRCDFLTSCAADEDGPVQTAIGQSDFGRSSHKSVLQKQDNDLAMAEDGASPPSKYKSSLLNRYLNDTLRHMMAAKASAPPSARKRRSHSESFSSSEDQDVVSPASSYETEANYVYRMGERCLFLARFVLVEEKRHFSKARLNKSRPGRILLAPQGSITRF